MARKKKETVGFANIEERVSRIAKKVGNARSVIESENTTPHRDNARTEKKSESDPSPKTSASTQPDKSAGSSSQPNNLGRNIVIAGAVVLVLYLIFQGSSENKNKTAFTTHTSPSRTQPTKPPGFSASDNPFLGLPSTDPSVRPPPEKPRVVKSNEETMPPVGSGHSLTTAQIRYCLYENERIDAMRDVINQFSDGEVFLFNRTVEDYNSRCGSFRYKGGALERVRNELASMRLALRNEGIQRILLLR